MWRKSNICIAPESAGDAKIFPKNFGSGKIPDLDLWESAVEPILHQGDDLKTNIMRLLRTQRTNSTTGRDGATAVEVALTLPIFGILLAGLMEFSHYFMVVHTLNAAARSGANYGSYAGVTNDQVIAKVNSVVQGAFATSKATVIVKDASAFDSSGVNPSTLNYNSLPSITLSQADTSDLFLVQVSVPYNDVALLPPWWIKNATITGRAVMRHE